MTTISMKALLICIFICQTGLAIADDPMNYTNADCRQVHNATDKCLFSKEADSCAIDEGFINYIQVVFCDFSNIVPLGIVIFILWWLFLFLALAVTADDFFCPSLTVMAKVLRMSDNIAGVTLLAFGNGAPDIFSAIAAIGSMKSGSDAGLAFGALIGAGVFVTAVVSGAVIIAKPFQCMERPLLRDITFYITALFYTFYIMYSRQITTLRAVGFLLIYVAYVIVVLVGRYIRKKRQGSSSQPSSPTTDGVSVNASIVARLERDPDLPTTFSKHLAEEAEHEENREPVHHHHHHHHGYTTITAPELKDDSKPFDNPADWDESSPLLDSGIRVEGNTSSWYEFWDAVNPICKQEWTKKKWYGKVYLIVKAPIQFVLTVTCPVVDYDTEKDNWNRPLSCIQVILGPLFAIFATNQYGVLLGNVFPLWALFLVIFTLLSCVVFWFSNNDTPPKWHPVLAFLGFVIAVVWIYSIANEIVNILQLFGVFFQISNAILGLTLLAWGNSIGDFIADTALARKGYPRIGISACFGGPLFNLLLGVGIPFTIGCIKNGGTMALDFKFQLIVLTGGLLVSLVSTYIIAPFVLKFFMRRWFGIYLILVYIAFLVIAILTEANVINVDVSQW